MQNCVNEHVYIMERDFLCKLDKNKPKELVELRKKFEKEVETELTQVWNNRKKLIMNIDLLTPWYPEDWESMTELQLYKHFRENFCTGMQYIKEMGAEFEQLMSSNIFGGQIKYDFAKEFNQFTLAGKRKCMANEYFLIWVRTVLKQLIKPERYMLGMITGNYKFINALNNNV